MSFGDRLVNFQCPQRGLPSLGIGIFRWNNTISYKSAVRISQSRIGERVSGIFLNGLLKEIDAFVQAIRSPFVEPVTALQIILIGVRIGGIAFGHALFILTR